VLPREAVDGAKEALGCFETPNSERAADSALHQPRNGLFMPDNDDRSAEWDPGPVRPSRCQAVNPLGSFERPVVLVELFRSATPRSLLGDGWVGAMPAPASKRKGATCLVERTQAHESGQWC
jgi:hypothetical protein